MAAVKWSLTIPAVLGVAAGILSSLIFSRMLAPQSPAASQEAPPKEIFVPVMIAPSAAPAAAHDQQPTVAQQTPPAPIQPPLPPPSDPAVRERERAQTIARHEEAIRNHKQQPVDPAWSRGAAAQLRSDLAEVGASSGFSIVEVECRTTSCISTLEWPSYGKALTGWQELLHHPYKSNCSREITLAEPEDGQGPYQATAVFDCEVSRTEEH